MIKNGISSETYLRFGIVEVPQVIIKPIWLEVITLPHLYSFITLIFAVRTGFEPVCSEPYIRLTMRSHSAT
jgi:hypothetical protein